MADYHENEAITITCSGGCITVEKALFTCAKKMDDIIPSHLDIMKEKCTGKESCRLEACSQFWGEDTIPECESGDIKGLWVAYKYVDLTYIHVEPISYSI